MKIPYKYHLLKTGDKLILNGKKHTILAKVAVPAYKGHSRITRYEFEDNYVLEFEKKWKFFQIFPFNFFLFEIGTVNNIEIREIETI